jgi:serine/threonine protein phosphatase 1
MQTPSRRLVAFGDVHGCIHALETLLEAIAPTADDLLVFLGDVVDHGRNANEVLQLLLELETRCRVVLIQGNHEQMMLDARGDEGARDFWERCGGIATLNSYRFPGRLVDVPDEHWTIIERSVPYYETANHIFTHANYLPEAPMSEQPAHQLRWALFDSSEMHPHMSGKEVLVGHTEQRNGEICDLGFATCIDMACWRDGWLTAIDVDQWQQRGAETSASQTSPGVWQASRWGMLREPGEGVQRERLAPLLTRS